MLPSGQAATASGGAGAQHPELQSRGEALPCWGHLLVRSAPRPPHASPRSHRGNREPVVPAGASRLGRDGQCQHTQT